MLPFTGCVLTGGESSRFGTDKAFAEFEGKSLVRVALDALADATELTLIGGDERRLSALGQLVWPDESPGEGPLGGIVTALHRAKHEDVVIYATDLPLIDRTLTTRLVESRRSTDADLAVCVASGRPQWTAAAWARRALSTLQPAFDAGERAIRRSLVGLRILYVVVDPAQLRDIDSRADLAAISQSGAHD